MIQVAPTFLPSPLFGAYMDRILTGDDLPIDANDATTDYPEEVDRQDLIDDGDLTMGPVRVDRTEAVVIAAHSEDDNDWSASVTWQDADENVIQEESASDIDLSEVTDDWVRLIRKGPEVEVTFTDESDGSANNINAFLDAHR